MTDLYNYNLDLIEKQYIKQKQKLDEYKYLFKVLPVIEAKIKKEFTPNVSSDMTIPIYINIHMTEEDIVSDIPLLIESLEDLLQDSFYFSEEILDLLGNITYQCSNKNDNCFFNIIFYPSQTSKKCEYVESGRFEPIMEWKCIDKEGD